MSVPIAQPDDPLDVASVRATDRGCFPHVSYAGQPQEVARAKALVERALQAAGNGDIRALGDASVIAALARIGDDPEMFEPLRERFCRAFCGQQFFSRDASLVIDRLTAENELLNDRIADQAARIAELEALL